MHEFGQKGVVPLSERIALSPEEASDLTDIGISAIRSAIASGELVARKLGRRVIILSEELMGWALQRRSVEAVASGDGAPDWVRGPEDRVYVIGFAKHVKIGFTRGPIENRMASIQTSCPQKLRVYGSFSGSKDVEHQLHHHFAAYNTNGEWFHRSGALAEWIGAGCPWPMPEGDPR
jgi:excisionase family DNA binding protein